MAEWEQMEMEPPCLKCLYWAYGLCTLMSPKKDIFDCEFGIKRYKEFYEGENSEMSKKCPNCDGKGFNTIYENNQPYVEDCEMCNGTGELRNDKTNRDKLMEMSNKEIAYIMDKDICQICAYDKNNCIDLECEDGIKEWLESYVEN